jgi:GT2 family glycosyltransferase
MTASPPRVSILIPNFDNGRASSVSGDRDFLGDLLASLEATLTDDPTPVEIVIADDGSTDDSLETARAWSERTWSGWRSGRPFCRLIELEHCGVLSRVANWLMNASSGDICCRLDGDVVIHTRGWASELVRVFDAGPPDLGVVGPRQLAPSGFLHAAGDWVLHPRGYHHIAQGISAGAVPRAAEVDHVMGCFYCMRRAVYDQVGPYDEEILRGQTVDFGLRARLHGWRCFYVPTISFTHYHEERNDRDNTADTKAGMRDALAVFRAKWGFDRLAPDLDAVAERYAGTPLLWNPRVFGPALAWPPLGTAPRAVESTSWTLYGREAAAREWMDARVDLACKLVSGAGERRRVLHVGAGDGLLGHLLAKRGVEVTGVERDPTLVDVARTMTERSEHETPPRFEAWSDLGSLPVEDGSMDLALVLDVVEWHPNPVGLYGAVRRALRPGGAVVILTQQRPNPLESDIDHLHRYRAHELNAQVRNTRLFDVVRAADPDPGPGGMLVVIGRAPAETPAGTPGDAPRTSAAPDRTPAVAR